MTYLWIFGACAALLLLLLIRLAASVRRDRREHIRHEEMTRFGFTGLRGTPKDWRQT